MVARIEARQLESVPCGSRHEKYNHAECPAKSNLAGTTYSCGSVATALPLHGSNRRFESYREYKSPHASLAQWQSNPLTWDRPVVQSHRDAQGLLSELSPHSRQPRRSDSRQTNSVSPVCSPDLADKRIGKQAASKTAKGGPLPVRVRASGLPRDRNLVRYR